MTIRTVKNWFSKSWYFTVLALLLFGCKSGSDKIISQEKYQELLSKSYMLKPDSLLTSQDIALKIKVMDFCFNNLTISDNHQQLDVTREELESQGIPSFYYDILQYQVYETNTNIEKWIEEGTLDIDDLNLDSSFKQAKDLYFKQERPRLLLRIRE